MRCIFSELSLAVIVSSFFLRQCSQLDDGLGFLEIKKLTLVIFLLDRRSHLVGLIHVEAHLTD